MRWGRSTKPAARPPRHWPPRAPRSRKLPGSTPSRAPSAPAVRTSPPCWRPPTSSTRARSWPAAAAARPSPPPCSAASLRVCCTTRGAPCWSCTRMLTDRLRAAAARVAGRARHVRIVEEAIEPYAATLPARSPPAPDLEGATLEQRAAFSLTLNAINFGSGWFPTLRKAPGMSGFRTVEAGLRAHGPWTADQLAAMTPDEIAAAVGQDPQHEL